MVMEVQGIYNNIDEVAKKVESLNKRGYYEDDIVVLSNKEVDTDLPSDADASEVNTDGTVEKSFWDRFKSALVIEDVENKENVDHSKYSDNLDDALKPARAEYRSELDAGKILVLVDSEAAANDGDYNKNENFEEPNEKASAKKDAGEPIDGVAPAAVAGTGVGGTLGSDNPAHDNDDRDDDDDNLEHKKPSEDPRVQ